MPPWIDMTRRVILGSQSPRRREILRKMDVGFDVVAPRVRDESAFLQSGDLRAALRALATEKARSVSQQYPDAAVIGADTVVAVNGTVLGKPADRDDAARMLRLLSGNTHQVHTGVALVCGESTFSQARTATTQVFFRELSDGEIEYYLDRSSWPDKAGAYAIQEEALVFIDEIEGCFYNVMGLPIRETLWLFTQYQNRRNNEYAGHF